MKIEVENVVTFAKLNYLRDATCMVDNEPVEGRSWDEVKDSYIEEAKFYANEASQDEQVILSEEEVDDMIKAATKK